MKLTVIKAGHFALDGGAMFGVVPKVLWQRFIQADDKNRIPMSMNTLLIETENRKILVDAGIGTKNTTMYEKHYAFAGDELSENLKAQSIAAEEITDVIITHMHFDHIGGLTYQDDDNNLKLRFPNAIHHVNERQWRWAWSPSPRDSASYLPENFAPLKGSDKLNLLDGPGELYDHIAVVNAEGHTPGQQLVKITDGTSTYFYMADLIPTHHHIPIPYVMGYDLNPLKTVEEKQAYLHSALSDKWTLIFEHDAKVAAGRIGKNEKHYFFSEEVELSGD